MDFVCICKIFYGVHSGAWNSLKGAAGHESRDCSVRLYGWVAVVNKTDHINLHSGVFALLVLKMTLLNIIQINIFCNSQRSGRRRLPRMIPWAEQTLYPTNLTSPSTISWGFMNNHAVATLTHKIVILYSLRS